MHLFREGIAPAPCAEDWSYTGNCPLPICNPGTCDDGQPLREYVYCRLGLIADSFAQTWRGGDILFFGDSNTDINTAYNIFPILPRTFNASVLGSRICDVTATTAVVQSWLDSLTISNPGITCSPSAAIIMAGTNDLLRDINGVDNSFTPATATMYEKLFLRLDQFRAANNDCDIIIRSVLPGIPSASGCCTDGYQPDTAAYKQAVLQANVFLASLCKQHGFTFLNDYNHFWDATIDTIRIPLYRNGSYFNPCTQQNFADHIHLGCPGQRVALTDVARATYAKAAGNSGKITALKSPPFGPPLKSAFPLNPNLMYRYFRRTLSGGSELTLTSKNSTTNYVAVFEPGMIGGLATTELLTTNASPATVYYSNSYDQFTVVACVGTNPNDPGKYEVHQT